MGVEIIESRVRYYLDGKYFEMNTIPDVGVVIHGPIANRMSSGMPVFLKLQFEKRMDMSVTEKSIIEMHRVAEIAKKINGGQ